MTESKQDIPPCRQEEPGIGATDQELLRTVEQIEQHLSLIQRERHRLIEDDERREALTAPQRQALIILAQANPSGEMTLKELSARMGLAQSTTSGIVDRLERKGLLQRHVSPTDRRATHLEVTDAVKAYLQQQLPEHLHSPLLSAVQRATSAERRAILIGLATLQRLLTEAQTERKP
jgi:MarR family transcriptional regulator, organic hydroperoxide resistance regulator